MENALWILPLCWSLWGGPKNLVVEAIRNVHECGLTVVAVVCDFLGANVAMDKLLGFGVP